MKKTTQFSVYAVLLVLVLSLVVLSNSFLVPSHPKDLTSLTWNGTEFISSYGVSSVHLATVSLDGKTVHPFAPSFVGKDEVYVAVSNGTGGFPVGYFINSGKYIYEISPTGDKVSLFSSPPNASRISYLAFDTVGSWDHVLFAMDDNGLLWYITSNGIAIILENFSNFSNTQSSQLGGIKPEGLVVAPMSFGNYGGYLFVTLEGAERILAISPHDPSNVIPIAQLNGEPEHILVIPPQSDLYVAKSISGTTYKMPAANLTGYVGSLIVWTEGEEEPSGLFIIIQASGNNITTTTIGTVPGSPHFEGGSFVPFG